MFYCLQLKNLHARNLSNEFCDMTKVHNVSVREMLGMIITSSDFSVVNNASSTGS